MEEVVLGRERPGERFARAVEVVEVSERVFRAERARALLARGFETGSVLGASEVDATARAGEESAVSRHLRGIATVKRVDAESDGAIDVAHVADSQEMVRTVSREERHEIATVSYTHLTLPTILLV